MAPPTRRPVPQRPEEVLADHLLRDAELDGDLSFAPAFEEVGVDDLPLPVGQPGCDQEPELGDRLCP